MQPVTIKNHKLIDGLWISQAILVTIMVAGLFFVPWPWLLLTVVPGVFIGLNHRQINNNQVYSVRLNQQGQWFVINSDELHSCQLSSCWHMAGFLSIRLESAYGKHYFIIMKRRLGSVCYAQLLMAVNQNE